MENPTLSKSVKKALEKDYFKALAKAFELKAKIDLLENARAGHVNTMESIAQMLGYVPMKGE